MFLPGVIPSAVPQPDRELHTDTGMGPGVSGWVELGEATLGPAVRELFSLPWENLTLPGRKDPLHHTVRDLLASSFQRETDGQVWAPHRGIQVCVGRGLVAHRDPTAAPRPYGHRTAALPRPRLL